MGTPVLRGSVREVRGMTDELPETAPGEDGRVIIRRSGQGWQVAGEELPDLTSAMVLADLLAPGLEPPGSPGSAGAAGTGKAASAAEAAGTAEGTGTAEAASVAGAAGVAGTALADGAALAEEAGRLRVTVAQLQHALATRVRVEQAIGVLCERRRMPPRAAFELLRGVARGSGLRVSDLAEQVVESAANPLLILPGDLARPPRQPRVRGLSPRHVRITEQPDPADFR